MNEDALHEYFIAEGSKKQKFGTVDCVSFVTGAVFAGWRRDYRSVLQYHDRRSAVVRLRELGGILGACDFAMGARHPVDKLSPGDVVYIEKPVASIGLLMPDYIAVKFGSTVHRYVIEPNMFGWKT